MPKKKRKEKEGKLFYSIGEVARRFGVAEPTLRYWEKEFDELHPRTSEQGTRTYQKEDLEVIRLILHLKGEGLTLEGIRRRLKESRSQGEREAEAVERLRHLRDELEALRAALDEIPSEQDASSTEGK
ncbi:MAG: MerR family transcriptional regulator [Tannerella sp.]|jgi:DNA-binding transcriptional MerR regulator|nr:MerR family transcriptional regulator [Tannerella sp.]